MQPPPPKTQKLHRFPPLSPPRQQKTSTSRKHASAPSTEARASTSKASGGRRASPPESSEDWLNRVELYAQGATDASVPPGLAIGREPISKDSHLVRRGILKSFQEEGVRWLISRHLSVSGCILADEMGTGKTLQTLAMLAFIKESGIHGFNLVIVPLAVLHNWKAECEKWTPSLKVEVLRGTPAERLEILKKLDKFASSATYERLRPTIITTFEMATNDAEFTSRLERRYHFQTLVIDEAQRIKNSDSKTYQALRAIKAEFKLLLTGTPIQNSLPELHALLGFCLPEIFSDRRTFEATFDFSAITSGRNGAVVSQAEKEAILVGRLRRILEPFMLRRLKIQVEFDLPLKRELVIRCPMTKRQRQLYLAAQEGEIRQLFLAEQGVAVPSFSRQFAAAPVADEAHIGERLVPRTTISSANYIDLTEDDDFEVVETKKDEATKKRKAQELVKRAKEARTRTSINGSSSLASILTTLRMVSNHPWLSDTHGQPESGKGWNRGVLKHSGKMMLLDRLLTRIMATKDSNSKVLIFSQFTTTLDLISEYLSRFKKWEHLQLNGEQKPEQADVKLFNDFNDSTYRLFLLSTRAGGVGITLTGADTVIIFDSDWNPQSDLQAMDRAHRIGQTRPVLVLRLETENSIDGLIIQRATRKRRLGQLILDDSGSTAHGLFDRRAKTAAARKEPTLEELLTRLVSAEQQSIDFAPGQAVLTDEQLDQVLDRSPEAMKGIKSTAPRTPGKGKGKAKESAAIFTTVETIIIDDDSDEEEGGVGAAFRVGK